MTTTRRASSRFAVAGFGLRETRSCEIKAGHGYYIGASSSPSFVLVLAVEGSMVRYANAYSLEAHRDSRAVFEDMACSALDTLKKHAAQSAANAVNANESKAAGRLAKQIEKACAGRVAAHGAPVTFADHDKVEARVSAPKGADVYGIAKNWGVVGDWDDDANKVSVECNRGDLGHLAAAGLTIESVRLVKACPTA